MPRTKSETVKAYARIEYRQGISTLPSTYIALTTDLNLSHDNTVTFGDNIKGWQDRVKNLQSATTSLDSSRSLWSLTHDVHSLIRYRRSSDLPTVVRLNEVRGCSGANLGGANDTASYTESNNGALQILNKKLDSATTAMQGLTALGELGESLRMLRGAGKSLFKGQFQLLDALKKGRKKMGRSPTSAQLRKYVADSWLEHSFGWAPLISDAKSAAKGISRLANGMPEHKIVTAKAGRQKTIAGTKGSYSAGDVTVNYFTLDTSETSVIYRACVGCSPPTFGGALDTFGISWDQVVPTVWELIPYSFLVDYFTNIGNIISAASANRANVKWIVKNTSFFTSRVRTIDSIRLTNPSSILLSQSTSLGSKSSRIDRNLHRTDHTGVGITPSLEFSIPGLGLKWLNLSALAASRQAARRLWST